MCFLLESVWRAPSYSKSKQHSGKLSFEFTHNTLHRMHLFLTTAAAYVQMCPHPTTALLWKPECLNSWSPSRFSDFFSTPPKGRHIFSLTHRGVVRAKEITMNNPHLFGIFSLKLFWNSCKLFQNYSSQPPFVIRKILSPQWVNKTIPWLFSEKVWFAQSHMACEWVQLELTPKPQSYSWAQSMLRTLRGF